MADIFDSLKPSDVFDEIATKDIFDTVTPPYGFAPGRELDIEGFGVAAPQRGGFAPTTMEELGEDAGEADFTGKTDTLLRRFGKQYYNVALAAPAQAIGVKSPAGIMKTDVKALRSLEEDVKGRYEKGEPLTQQEIDDYSKPYSKWSLGGLLGVEKPEWQQKLREDYQTGRLTTKEPETQEVKMKKLQGILGAARVETAKKADISFAVSEAENWKEKGVDVVAGVTGFVSQLMALKKAFPTAPAIFHWELQNQITGGTPGKGALTYSAFALPGKVIKGVSKAAKVGRVASESFLLGGMSAVEQKIDTGEIKWGGVAVSAAIPIGLRVPAAAKKGMSKLISRAILTNKISSKVAGKAAIDIVAKSKQTGIPIENIVGNIETVRQAPKIISRFPQKIKDQASLESLGNAIKDHMGLRDWDVVWELVPKTKKGPVATAKILAKDIKAAKIKIALPSGMFYGKGGLKITPTVAGQVPRAVGEAIRHTQGTAKRAIVHELGHLKFPPKVLGGKAKKIIHSKEFADWTNNKVKGLFAERPGKVIPKKEVGLKEEVVKRVPLRRADGWEGLEKRLSKGAIAVIERSERIKEQPLFYSIKERKDAQKVLTAATNLLKSNEKIVAHAKEASKQPRTRHGASLKIEKPNLTKEEWDVNVRKIKHVLKEKPGMRDAALDGLGKIKNNKPGTISEYETQALRAAWGEEANLVLGGYAKHRGYGWFDVPMMAVQAGKTIFGLDVQVSRQASISKLRHPILYKKAQYANIRGYGSALYAKIRGGQHSEWIKKAEKKLKASTGYEDSKEAGINYISTKVGSEARLEYFRGGFTELLAGSGTKSKSLAVRKATKPLRMYGKLLQSSEEGAALGINTLLKGQYDIAMKHLNMIPNLTETQRKGWIANRVKTINTNMKILRSKNPSAIALKNASNYLLFSPSVSASRPWALTKLFTKYSLTGKGFGRAYQAQVITTNIAQIFLNTSIPVIIGTQLLKQKPNEEPKISGELNPLSTMWGKSRVGDEVYDNVGGDAQFYRTLARIGVSVYLYGQEKKLWGEKGLKQEFVPGREIPVVGEVFPPFSGVRVPSWRETLLTYAETRETAIIGLAKTLATGKDFVGKPIPWYGALRKAITPEVLQATMEAGFADGTWEALVTGIPEGDLKPLMEKLKEVKPGAAIVTGLTTYNSVGVSTYPVSGANRRGQFRDAIANEEHKQDWNNLTLKEQRKLLVSHRKEFEVFSEQIEKERVERPYDYSRQVEQIRQSDIRIKKGLSESNRKKVEGTSVGVGRMPGKFFLNDERYQLYQELTTKYLNERLPKIKLAGKSYTARKKILDLVTTMVRKKAWYEVQREMK